MTMAAEIDFATRTGTSFALDKDVGFCSEQIHIKQVLFYAVHFGTVQNNESFKMSAQAFPAIFTRFIERFGYFQAIRWSINVSR